MALESRAQLDDPLALDYCIDAVTSDTGIVFAREAAMRFSDGVPAAFPDHEQLDILGVIGEAEAATRQAVQDRINQRGVAACRAALAAAHTEIIG